MPTQDDKIADILEQPLDKEEGRYGRAAGEAQPQEEREEREVQEERKLQNIAQHQDIKLIFKQIERHLEKSILDSIGGWRDIVEEIRLSNKMKKLNSMA